MFAGRTARLAVSNDGEDLLELTVEPWADIHRIWPKDTCIVVTHLPPGNGTWGGTLSGDEPFEVKRRPDSITVWAYGHCFRLSDREGNPICANEYGGGCPAQNPAT
ncbi:hypothetical protein SLAV_38045 [Streptomyces lavendulae subsp. lavendulae]|uniref:Uncharacterized protein n=2 Tax=Streptomyces lavendulae TaxID=1914 RepID=A0A2K8PU57_STRLA|nr:hypothetical protein SLAV_38045 [Streptomyces lavendulae subsp. lavendulae]QUQ59183.1 hypothetical protein SLLC_36185 [Streptomyces lavendulae subsp. lavendulae]